ncbi:MAG: DNRLRE domain-containing protein, partial [Phycisphaerae bacterium]|nr:DNRLRE domain-containing protein [Phycisphaerae bacterium]
SCTPVADASLYEPAAPNDAPFANGSGQFLFAGRTFEGLYGLRRRALLRFDLSAIPESAVVTSATLTLTLVQYQGGPSDLHVHRALAPWTTGASDPSGNEGKGAPAAPNDCTWSFATYLAPGEGTPWSLPGGDFVPEPSASLRTESVGPNVWTGAGLVDDVQAFVSDPASNHGWFLLGDESQPGTARRFDSGNAEPGLGDPPVLTVTWIEPAGCNADLDGSGAVDAYDLGLLLGSWGAVPQGNPDGDLSGNGTIDGEDVAILLRAWGPCDA